MSIESIRAMRKLKIDPTAKAVLSWLAWHNNNGVLFPSIRTLIEDTCLSKRTVIYALHKLEKNGYIETTRIKGRGNTYKLLLPVQELHQSISDTGAGDAPHRCKRSTTTGAGDAPPLVQEMHPISKEISKEIKKDKPPIVPHPYSEIIEDLNNKAGTKYRSTTPKTQGLIKARFNEGFTLEDFKTVHTKKCKEWLGGEYAKFLRPETLYGTKFEGYLNQTILPSTTEKSKTRYDLEVEEAERREAVMKRNEREQAEAKREREEDARRIQLEKVLVEAYWKGLDTLEQKMIEGEADLQTRAGFKNRTVLDDSAEFRLVFKAKKHIIIMEKMEEK